MNKQFTPGAWEIMEDGGSKTLWSLYAYHSKHFVIVDATASEADIRLIAAAPEMFELLEAVLKYGDGTMIIKDIEKLLAKITTP